MKRLLMLSALATLAACSSGSETVAPSPDEAPASPAAAEATTLRGSLVAHDGQPLALAEIHVSMPGVEPFDVAAAADGSFTLELPGPGWASLRMTGVGHEEHTMGVLASGGAHELSVALGTYDRAATLTELAGFGMFGASNERLPLEFEARDDGTFVATIERPETADSGEFRYQLANATQEGRTMNGTQADRYVYDGGGDYFSVIDVDTGEAFEIVFDPGALPPAGAQMSVSFADPSSSFARVATRAEELRAWELQSRVEFRRAVNTAPDGDLDALYAASRATLAAKIAASLELEDDPVIQRMLLIAWAGAVDTDAALDELRGPVDRPYASPPPWQALASRVLAEVGPRDPLWSMDVGAMGNALELIEDPEYFAIAVSEHPDVDVGASLWMRQLSAADTAGDQPRARAAMSALSKPRFADSPATRFASFYDPDRPTAPGREIPNFRVSSIDGKTEYGASDLRGKFYVLDFWATWCGPCVAEMPSLHAAYAALNGQAPPDQSRAYEAVAEPKLEIISVSFDHDAAKVAGFRAEAWPMPWAHAVPDVDAHKQLSEMFGIVGIPTMVLVGPDGTILASSPRLDGGSLGEIARPYL